MNEELIYVLEESNKKNRKNYKEESFVRKLKKRIRTTYHENERSGSFGIFLNKEEGTFNRNDIVMERYLYGIKERLILMEKRIGVVLDKIMTLSRLTIWI